MCMEATTAKIPTTARQIVATEIAKMVKRHSTIEARAAIATAAADTMSSSGRLQDLVQRLAVAEANEAFWTNAAKVHEADTSMSCKAAWDFATQTLRMPTDDAWSGRGNDLRRVAFDARQVAAVNMHEIIEFARGS